MHSNTSDASFVPRPPFVLLPRRASPETKNTAMAAVLRRARKLQPNTTKPMPFDSVFNDLIVSSNHNIKQSVKLKTRIHELTRKLWIKNRLTNQQKRLHNQIENWKSFTTDTYATDLVNRITIKLGFDSSCCSSPNPNPNPLSFSFIFFFWFFYN